jgi:hypothetical protein
MIRPGNDAQRPPTGNPGAAIGKPAAPRKRNEETKQVNLSQQNTGSLDLGDVDDADDLENIGERTMITAAPGSASNFGGFMMDADNNLDGVDATMVTGGPPQRPDLSTDLTGAAAPDDTSDEDDDGGDFTAAEPHDEESDDASSDDEQPTLARDFRPHNPKVRTQRKEPPAALAAKIHAPAVSELRKPRPSKRTPQGGVPVQPNVLQQIVSRQGSEPMPVPQAPRPQPPPPAPAATPTGFPPPHVGGYMADASGMPVTPPTGTP